MKLGARITAAAFVGLAAAAVQDSADVYILQAGLPTTNQPPQLPKEVTRHILLQRASRDRYGSSLGDIVDIVDQETAVSHISTYAKPPAPLFASESSRSPSQLVLIIEGIGAEDTVALKAALSRSNQQPAFLVSNPPSAAANNRLIDDFNKAGVPTQPAQCTFDRAINPFDDECWSESSSVVKYDVKKAPRTVATFADNLSRLLSFVERRELEAAIVLMPESSRFSKLPTWSTVSTNVNRHPVLPAADLRRRDEHVFAEEDKEGSASKVNDKVVVPSAHAWADKERKSIPSCFQSLSSCESTTNKCSGHGECVDKYSRGNGTESSGAHARAGNNSDVAVCFTCRCLSTVVREGGGEGLGRKTVHWGGAICQKEDISVPFWLLAGFTVAIIGAVSFAIGLLYSVGEEKLPGVIGAGVNRGASRS